MSDANVQHGRKETSIFPIALNLMAACIISGLIIAAVYFVTYPIAVEKNEMLKEQAMKALVADADRFEPMAEKEQWFAAKKGDNTIAYIVPGESKGYGGTIKMLVAVSADGRVVDYNILTANETPGLGDKASQDFFRDRLKRKKSEDLLVVKDPSNKQNVDALTGATITSSAVVKGVREAVDEVVHFTGGK